MEAVGESEIGQMSPGRSVSQAAGDCHSHSDSHSASAAWLLDCLVGTTMAAGVVTKV